MTAQRTIPAFGRVSEFQIAESKTFCQHKQHIDFALYDRIKSIVYPQLRKNPFCGPNIRQLTGDLAGYYRFRIGDYRLLYLVDEKQAVVAIVALQLVRRAASASAHRAILILVNERNISLYLSCPTIASRLP